MKILVQKVSRASCTVDNNVISKINDGLLIFVGIRTTDTIDNIKYLAKKIANLRIFPNEQGKVDKSVIDLNFEILSISQFTLYGDTSKGNRPSFTEAMEPIKAKELYLKLNEELRTYNINVLEGEFGADMKIELLNDGPMTIIMEN